MTIWATLVWSNDKLIPEQTLVGILFASCRNTITIVKSEQTKFGYKILLSSSIRAELETLKAIQRTLLHFQIESNLIPKESKSYPKPILKITKIKNLHKLVQLILGGHTINGGYANLPISMLTQWLEFERVINLIMSKIHYTTKGFDMIVKIKEGWNGGN